MTAAEKDTTRRLLKFGHCSMASDTHQRLEQTTEKTCHTRQQSKHDTAEGAGPKNCRRPQMRQTCPCNDIYRGGCRMKRCWCQTSFPDV